MFRVEVEFREHTNEVMLELSERLGALCAAGAVELSANYRQYLTRRRAKPHSPKGGVPIAYNGPKYASLDERYSFDEDMDSGLKNNRPEAGFAKVQTDFLANYISSDGGYIGFRRDGHVARRSQNYLIGWDNRISGGRTEQGTDPRPWIRPIYQRYKIRIRSRLRQQVRSGAFRNTNVDDVPF